MQAVRPTAFNACVSSAVTAGRRLLERVFGIAAEAMVGFRYRIDVSDRLMLLQFEDRIDWRVMSDLFRAMQDDPDRSPDQNCLCDVSRVVEVDLNFSQALGLSSTRADFYRKSTGSHVAVWAPTDMVYGTARMFLAMLDGYDGISADVFRDLNDAAAFVGCAPQALARLSRD